MTKERKALLEALAMLRGIRREQAGPNFTGKAHKLRAVHLPALAEILKKGLEDD